MEKNKSRFGFTKNVWIMGFVSFLNDLSSEMVNPVVPIFLTTVLGAPASVVGLIEGIADATSNLLMAVTGIESDREQKRKPFIIAGYGLSTLSKLLYSLANVWPVVLIGRVINRAGKGVRTTSRDALIVESTQKEDRGTSFGFHRMMDSAGAIFGPLLSVTVLALLNNNFRLMFFWAFVPSALAMLLLFFLTEKRRPQLMINKMQFEWRKTNSSFRIFLVISMIFTLASSSYAFLILRAQELGMVLSSTVFAYVLLNIANTLTSLPAGWLADKIGSKKVLFLGFLLFSLTYFLFGFAKEQWWMWMLFPLYGVYISMTDGVGKAYISKLIPHEIAASAFGIYQMLLGFTTFASSALAGFMWTTFGSSAAFYLSSGLGVLSAILFLLLSKRITLIELTSSK